MRYLAPVLLLTMAVAGCGDADGDSDGDGLLDSVEKDGWVIVVEYMDRKVRVDVSSSPSKADTDGDGITDFEEFTILTDPSNPDTDGDGLSDCQERFHTDLHECMHGNATALDGGYGTDPTKADSDPGPSRYKSAQPWVDRVGSNSQYQARWGDGLSDGDEVAGYHVVLPNGATRFVQTDPRSADSDGDGLEDAEEIFLYEGDPLSVDTDGDGCIDGQDVFPGAAERYDIGLESFTLLEDKDDTGGADLRVQVNIAENVFFAPTSGSLTVAKGQTLSLSGHDGSPKAMKSCIAAPYAPWLILQVIPQDVDDQSAEPIESYSLSGNPDHEPGRLGDEIYWHARNGEFSWSLGGPTFSAPIEYIGTEGKVTFSPRVTGL